MFGGFCGWLAAKPSPPQGYVVRRIVLAVTRPWVSIRVTGLGFEPFSICGIPTKEVSSLLLDIGFTTKPYHTCDMG